MIVNFYLSDQDSELVNKLKSISDKKRRSFSFVVREALEYYLHSSTLKSQPKKKEAQ